MKLRQFILAMPLLYAVPAFSHNALDFSDLVEEVSDAVVNVSIIYRERSRSNSGDMPEVPFPQEHPWSDFLEKFFDEHGTTPFPFDARSVGSGFIISKDGYVITNEHVVSGVRDSDEIVIKLSDRRELLAEIVGLDKNSDIALLKVEAKALPVVKLGNSESLRPGQGVLAIGSPFGFAHSVTSGIVSATERSLPQANYISFIQTDVAVNPGNSGGPLFDLDGKVVAINSHIYSRNGGFMGVSFAIPVELAIYVTEQLKEKGFVSMGWLGVYIQEVTRELAESFEIDKPRGALVSGLLPDSPAEKAGVKVGDLILAFDDKPIGNVSGLPPLVGRTEVGKEVAVSVLRKGKVISLDIVVGELPQEEEPEIVTRSKTEETTESYSEVVGLTLYELSKEEIEERQLREGALLVKKVDPGSPAQNAGILQGDLLVMINNRRFDGFDEFMDIVKDMPEGNFVTLLVMRGEMTRFLAMKIPAED